MNLLLLHTYLCFALSLLLSKTTMLRLFRFSNISSFVVIIILSAYLLATTTVVSGLSTKQRHHLLSSRRGWIGKFISTATTSTLCITTNHPAVAVQEVKELPINVRKYTALAPLGGGTITTTSGNNNKKLTGLSMESIASKLSNDLVDGSTGKGGYFISGMRLIYHILPFIRVFLFSWSCYYCFLDSLHTYLKKR